MVLPKIYTGVDHVRRSTDNGIPYTTADSTTCFFLRIQVIMRSLFPFFGGVQNLYDWDTASSTHNIRVMPHMDVPCSSPEHATSVISNPP